MDTFVIIDGSSFCYRAYYALKDFSTSWGLPTGAVFGFANMINKIKESLSPNYMCVCFDVSRHTFRVDKYADYKTHRPPTPSKLSVQFPYIRRLLSHLNIPVLEKEGFEADDIIASLIEKLPNHLHIVIVSNDKDILQLVEDERIIVYDSIKQEFIDEQKLLQRFSIPPKNIPDLLALKGDSIDNIPGVKGIGSNHAIRLLKEYGNVENIIKNINSISPVSLKKIIEDNIDVLRMSKELATLKRDIDISASMEEFKVKTPNYIGLYKLYKELEFNSLLNKFPPLPQEEIKVNLKKIDKLPSSIKEIVFITDVDRRGIVFAIDSDFYFMDFESAKSVLQDAGIKKITYDFKTQMHILKREGISLEGEKFDVMVASYLDNPSRISLRLKDLSLEYLDKFIDDSLSVEALYIINKLYPLLEKILKDKNLYNLFKEVEMPLVDVLFWMEEGGIKIDISLLQKFLKDIDKKIKDLLDRIYSITGGFVNVNSPKQLATILFERLKLPVIKRTKTGPSTDEKVLVQLAKYHILPQLLLEYRKLIKIKSTYIEPFLKYIKPSDSKIHAVFNQTSTSTGRLSCSEPNLQNIPTTLTEQGFKLREVFVSSFEEGFLASFDYSQIELRVLAHLSEDSNLIRAFQENKDIHKFTASLVFGVPEEEITPQLREKAKRVNFGIIYGMSSYGLSQDLGISVEEAQRLIDEYFTRYPQVKEYVEKVITQVERQGFTTTILGRRRYLPFIKSQDSNLREYATRQARNFPIQGSSADLIKKAMVDIYKEFIKRNLSSQLCIQIHDELIFDVRKEELEILKEIVKDKMENVYPLKVPLVVEVKIGRTWAQLQK